MPARHKCSDRPVQTGPLAALRIGEDEVKSTKVVQDREGVSNQESHVCRPRSLLRESRPLRILLYCYNLDIPALPESVDHPGGSNSDACPELEDASTVRDAGRQNG